MLPPESTPGKDAAPAVSAAASVAMVCLSAALFMFAFEPWGVRVLAWVALAPLLAALRLGSFARALWLAALWSMAFSYGITDWLIDGVSTYYQQGIAVGVFMLVAATFLGGTLEYVPFAAAYVCASRRGVAATPMFTAAAWSAAELGRTRVGTGNPWGLIGYTQSGLAAEAPGGPGELLALLVTQVADFGGVYAVTFVLVAVNAAFAELALCCVGASSRRRALHAALSAAMVVAGAGAYGAFRLANVAGTDAGTAQGATAVAVVQGNLELGSQWKAEHYGQNLDVYLQLTDRVARAHAPALVVWPENAMTFFVDREPRYRTVIADTIAPYRAQLVAGTPRFEKVDGDTSYYNSVVLLQPDGSVGASYDKQRLLPFAEYFPLGSVDLLRRRFGRVREFTAGSPRDQLPTVAGRAGVLVCNEAMYPADAVERVRGGAEYLINLSNDTWLADEEFSKHVYAMAALRAVEHRRYLVRASTSGPSAIVAPDGRSVVRSPLFVSTTIAGDVIRSSAWTPYTRFGDAFAFGCLALAAAWLVVLRRSRR